MSRLNKGLYSSQDQTWMTPPALVDALLKFEGRDQFYLDPCCTETRYQHDFGLTKAGFTVFLKGRLHFLQNGEGKGSAPFPTMLLYFGDDWKEKAARWVANPPLEGTLMIRGGQE